MEKVMRSFKSLHHWHGILRLVRCHCHWQCGRLPVSIQLELLTAEVVTLAVLTGRLGYYYRRDI